MVVLILLRHPKGAWKGGHDGEPGKPGLLQYQACLVLFLKASQSTMPPSTHVGAGLLSGQCVDWSKVYLYPWRLVAGQTDKTETDEVFLLKRISPQSWRLQTLALLIINQAPKFCERNNLSPIDSLVHLKSVLVAFTVTVFAVCPRVYTSRESLSRSKPRLPWPSMRNLL